jgi:hypothetical protein
VPNVADLATCRRLRSLHFESGAWTTNVNAAPVYNAATKVCTVSQTVNSLSPFVIALGPVPTYTISGQITKSGAAMQNVSVALSGSMTATTQTDASGNYSFTNLNESGNYIVRPTLSNFAFTPSSASFTDLVMNQTANFAAAECIYSITPNGVIAGSGGGAANFAVTAPAGCAWTAATTFNWITITSGSPGNGNGTISYSVAANSGPQRNGTITVAGQSFIITQSGSVLSISGTVSYATAPANQSKLVSGVLMNAGSGNSATTNSSGIYLLDNLASGVNYTVTPSKTTGRNGITAFDATLVLRCVAAGANCILNANQRTAANSDGDGGVTAFDATQILRYVAANGQNANTGQVGNWKFNPVNRPYQNLSENKPDENYTAFLIGEVDGDWNPQNSLAETAAVEAEQEGKESVLLPLLKAKNSSLIIEAPKTEIDPSQESELIFKADETEETTAEITELQKVEAPEIQLSLPEHVSAIAGNTISVPVLLTNETGKEISSYSFAVRFDPTVLQPEGAAETRDSLSQNGFLIVSDTNQKGRIGIAASAMSDYVNGSGILIYLRFRVIDSKELTDEAARTAISFEISKKRDRSNSFADGFGNLISPALSNGSLFIVPDGNRD